MDACARVEGSPKNLNVEQLEGRYIEVLKLNVSKPKVSDCENSVNEDVPELIA